MMQVISLSRSRRRAHSVKMKMLHYYYLSSMIASYRIGPISITLFTLMLVSEVEMS
jgi:hypothetical protein